MIILEISRLRIVDNKEQKLYGNATFANSSNIILENTGWKSLPLIWVEIFNFGWMK